jgi:L-asparaginase II
MNPSIHLPLVELTRGNRVESIHFGSTAIAESGRIIKTYGDAHTPFFLRSSAKPIQALALLEHDGAKIFNLTLEEIAILCSSHSGTDKHVAILKGLQKKIGIQEADLQCGIHPPYDKNTQEQLLLRGEKPTPLRHNCSGKHTGMLALAKILGAPTDHYLSIEHPVQQLILKTFSEICDIPIKNVAIGIDGCSAPVFAIPLTNAAMGFAHLADPASLTQSRAEACRQVYRAMTENAEIVAGPERFDTVFMTTMQGRAMSKIGAEGYLAIAIPGERENPKKPGLGITIKISDGDLEHRAAPVAALEILRILGILKSEDASKLASFNQRELVNWRGLTIGAIRPSQQLSAHFT